EIARDILTWELIDVVAVAPVSPAECGLVVVRHRDDIISSRWEAVYRSLTHRCEASAPRRLRGSPTALSPRCLQGKTVMNCRARRHATFQPAGCAQVIYPEPTGDRPSGCCFAGGSY